MLRMTTDATSIEAVRQQAIALLMRHAPADGVHVCDVPGLQLIRASAPAQPLPAVYEPGLVLVLQGRKTATLGTEVLQYDPLHCLLVAMTLLPVGQVTQATVTQPYLCLRLHCSPQTLAELLIETGSAAAGAGAATYPTRGLNLAPVSAELLDASLRLLRLLDARQDVPVLAPMLRREIFYRVLTGPLGPRLRSLALEHSRGRRVGRALELLQERWDQPLRIDELAAAAHMSPSTLHLHFKQLTAQSPLQYQKQLRLQRARQMMLSEGLDAASAAHKVGYESPSLFSREYRRLFGAPPRTEVQQLA